MFTLEPGDDPHGLDAISGRHPIEWGLTDLRRAMNAHASRFGVVRTMQIFTEVTTLFPCTDIMKRVKAADYARLIVRYTTEMIDESDGRTGSNSDIALPSRR